MAHAPQATARTNEVARTGGAALRTSMALRARYLTLLTLVLGCGSSRQVLFALDASRNDAGQTKSDAQVGMVDGSDTKGDADAIDPACGAFRPAPDFNLCTAGYLGSAGDDEATAVAYAADGRLLVAGSFGDLGVKVQTAIAGSDGALVWLDAYGRSVERVQRVGDRVADMAVADDGFIALTGTFGWVILTPDGSSIAAQGALPAPGLRIAIISGKRAAVLGSDKTLHWVGAFEEQALSLPDDEVTDLALHPQTGNLFVTGAHRVTGGCQGLVPFLRSYDESGKLLQSVYDHADAQGQCASSRGVRVQLGQDGKLYYGGENTGGNTVHLKDPRDLSIPAPLVSYDKYTAGYGQATQTYGFAARFEPSTLNLELAQVLLPRVAEMGGTLRVTAIDADAQGHVYFGGQASCCMAERDQLQLGGLTPGTAPTLETSLVLLAPEFNARSAWLTWSGVDAPDSRVVDVAVGERSVAVLAQTEAGTGSMLTVSGPRLDAQGGQDAFLSVFPAP